MDDSFMYVYFFTSFIKVITIIQGEIEKESQFFLSKYGNYRQVIRIHKKFHYLKMQLFTIVKSCSVYTLVLVEVTGPLTCFPSLPSVNFEKIICGPTQRDAVCHREVGNYSTFFCCTLAFIRII